MYEHGYGVEQNDEEAMIWYLRSAEQKYVMAYYSIGWMYLVGDGVEQNFIESKNWLSAASSLIFNIIKNEHRMLVESNREILNWHGVYLKKNDMMTQYKLGCKYFFGLGVDEDYEKALSFFLMAAEKNHVKSQYYLGILFLRELETINYEEAMKWLLLAAKQNHHQSQYELGCMYQLGKGCDINLEEARRWFILSEYKYV